MTVFGVKSLGVDHGPAGVVQREAISLRPEMPRASIANNLRPDDRDTNDRREQPYTPLKLMPSLVDHAGKIQKPEMQFNSRTDEVPRCALSYAGRCLPRALTQAQWIKFGLHVSVSTDVTGFTFRTAFEHVGRELRRARGSAIEMPRQAMCLNKTAESICESPKICSCWMRIALNAPRIGGLPMTSRSSW